MVLHFATIAAQCAALAAFLMLWYSWTKKQIETSYLTGGEKAELFPFRSFAWVFLGLVLVTCIVQIHFIRVSATVHERLAVMTDYYQAQDQNMRSVEELKASVERLRRDMHTNFQGLRAQTAMALQAKTAAPRTEVHLARADSVENAQVEPPKEVRIAADTGFAREARSFSKEVRADRKAAQQRKRAGDNAKAYSMRLSRMGRVLHDNLLVKKRPLSDAPVLEYLAAGQEVKVTEKRLLNEEMWFRVVTPSGHAGWVDYRHVKLEGNS
jgi:hypothetical protein